MALSKEDMEKLVVRGSGSDIKAKLEACGVEGGEVRADIIIPAEAGKVKRSRWALIGDMGMVDVSTHRLDQRAFQLRGREARHLFQYGTEDALNNTNNQFQRGLCLEIKGALTRDSIAFPDEF